MGAIFVVRPGIADLWVRATAVRAELVILVMVLAAVIRVFARASSVGVILAKFAKVEFVLRKIVVRLVAKLISSLMEPVCSRANAAARHILVIRLFALVVVRLRLKQNVVVIN